MFQKLQKLQEDIQALPYGKREKKKPEDFYLLLSLVPSIASNLYGNTLRVCDEQDVPALQEHLAKFDITDKVSLLQHIDVTFYNGDQYEQFKTFWDGNPCFDVNELKEEGRAYFELCKGYAEKLRPFVKEYGFHAWDIGESINRLREGYTAGLINEEEAMKMIGERVQLARNVYLNFKDYAISYICGGMYFMYRESDGDEAVVESMFTTLESVIRRLFFDDNMNLWATTNWLCESEYFNNLEDIVDYVKDLDIQNLGCFVTDKIAKNGASIGYCYHEKGDEKFPDSGWRFFAGDEDETYLADIQHTHIFSLNMVLNAEPRLLKIIHAPVGTAFERTQDGEYIEVKDGN